MKRFYILFILIFLTQAIYSQRFGGGFLAGLSMTQLDGDSWGGYHKQDLQEEFTPIPT